MFILVYQVLPVIFVIFLSHFKEVSQELLLSVVIHWKVYENNQYKNKKK